MITVENTEALRDWLVEELEPVCDADPTVLSKYILALIKRDKDEQVLRTKCLTSLDVFLAKETPAFVDKLIHALVTQSYVQEEYDPTDWKPNEVQEVEEKTTEADDKEKEVVTPEKSRTKEVKEDDEASPEDAKEEPKTERDRSLSSISSASGDEKLSRSKSRSNSKEKTKNRSRSPRHKRKPNRRQVIDDRSHRRKRRDDKIVRKKRKEKTKKCPDYEEKGFCKKGDSCPFDHGSDPFKVDKLPPETMLPGLFPTPFAAFPPPPGMPFPFPPPSLMTIPPPGMDMFLKPVPPPSTNILAIPERAPKRQASDNIIALTQTTKGHENAKRPRFTPWVKGRGTPDNCTLELRKIPQALNTEEKLREHFEKFGTVVSVSVGIATDLQAATVTFGDHATARSACQAPEPIFNNRFIAVFWHAGSGTLQTSQNGSNAGPEISNNGQPQTASGAATAVENKYQQNQNPAFRRPAVTKAQRVALAKSQMMGGANSARAQAQIEQQEALKQQKVESTMKLIQAQEDAKKKKEEERKAAIKMKTNLIEQKRELLAKYVEEQKKLLEKLEKGKGSLSAGDKKLILSTLKTLEETCVKLRQEIDELLNAAKPKPVVPPKPPPAAKLLSSSPLQKHKQETQKELLDAELELLTDKNADEKMQLQRRLIELKKEAVLLGLMGRSKPTIPPQVIPGMNAPPKHFGSVAPPSAVPMQQPPTPGDSRPKTIKVSGFEVEEKDEVIHHFSKLGKVEQKWEENGVLYFEYRNRIDSLNAAQKGFKFKNKTLTVHWHRGAHRLSSTSLDDSGSASLNNSSTSNSSFLTPNTSVNNTHELARARMESRDNSFSALLTEDDEEEAERFWRLTANASY